MMALQRLLLGNETLSPAEISLAGLTTTSSLTSPSLHADIIHTSQKEHVNHRGSCALLWSAAGIDVAEDVWYGMTICWASTWCMAPSKCARRIQSLFIGLMSLCRLDLAFWSLP